MENNNESCLEGSFKEKKALLKELLEIDHPDSELMLLKALVDKSESLRAFAAEELINFKSTATEKALIAALDDPWWIVRYYSIKALATFKSKEAIGPLISKSSIDLKSNIRKIVAERLGDLGTGPKITRVLIALAKDKVEDIRNTAMFSLEKIDSDEAREFINKKKMLERKKAEKMKKYQELFGDIDG
ncbi:MAG: HEAT repeat domain-containing protein [Candidatus Hodarchaeales archaeon]